MKKLSKDDQIIYLITLFLCALLLAGAVWAYETEKPPLADTWQEFGPIEFDVEGFALPGILITWENGFVDVVYDEGVTKTEAARQFFDYLKQYIEGEYILIPRIEYEQEKMKK